MDSTSLLALHHHLKSGAPRGRTGGMGLGVQRARRAVSSDLPDNKLYKNFVREGALLTEEEWVGGPKFVGKRETFEEEAEAEAEAGAEAGPEPAAAHAPAPAGPPLTLKAMKAFVAAYLAGSKRRRAKHKFVRSVAIEEAASGEGAGEAEEEAAGELFDRAVRKLVKRGACELLEEGAVLALCGSGSGGEGAGVAAEEAEEAPREGKGAKRSKHK